MDFKNWAIRISYSNGYAGKILVQVSIGAEHGQKPVVGIFQGLLVKYVYVMIYTNSSIVFPIKQVVGRYP